MPKAPGCGFLIAEKLLPFVSLVSGFAGLDRVLIGDWWTGARKMATMFAVIWSISANGERHFLTIALFYLMLLGWVRDIIQTRRAYHKLYGMPSPAPTAGKAFLLAVFGLSGIDRFYLGDTFLGAVKLVPLVLLSMNAPFLDAQQSESLQYISYCWWACDLILSPLRARLQ